MNEQNRAAMMPTLLFFGGLALILVALFATKPPTVKTTVTPVSSTTTSETSAPPTQVVIVAPPTVQPTAEAVAMAALDPVAVKAGENVFQSVCFACHGFDAKGIPGLGKTLVGSTFVNSESDEQLVAFLNKGRDVTDPLNTTGVLMPAKGGNPSLTDEDLMHVIAYIRSLNGGTVGSAPEASEPTVVPTTVATGPTSVPATFSAIDTSGLAAPTSAATESSTSNTTSSFGNSGQTDYVQYCAGCHGVNGEGQYLLTKPLTESEMVKSLNSMGILALFNTAHGPANPEAGFQHPYRGGYPELRDDQLLGLITYLFTLKGS